jgi:hypothetical protein
MGISMRVYLAPDSDLYAFAHAPRTLQLWLRSPRSLPDVSLQEYWKDLDAILASEPSMHPRSPLTATGADLRYPSAADRGAHALSSTSTAHLLRSLEQVARPQVEAYVRQAWAAQALEAGLSSDLSPVQLSEATDELVLYLSRLRESCTLAVAKGYGLLMALWDEV